MVILIVNERAKAIAGGDSEGGREWEKERQTSFKGKIITTLFSFDVGIKNYLN